MYNFAATPSLYPDLVNNESNLAALMNLTPLQINQGVASFGAIGAGWYLAHKLESQNVMYGSMAAAPALGFAVGLADGTSSYRVLGAILTEAVGGTLGYLFRRDFTAGATGGAISSVLYQLYNLANK